MTRALGEAEMVEVEFRNLPVPIVPRTADEAQHQARMVDAGFWPKLHRLATRLPFAEDLLAAWYASRDPKTPRKVKIGLTAALAYFILPIDTVPDWIAGLGYGDDFAVLLAAIRLAADAIKDSHRASAREKLDRLRQD
jgi:uncharacterized membrane protein YkvA (DUF1232 family)